MSQKDGAFVVLFRDETKSEVFLVLRSDKPIWNLPGGGIEENETPEDAAIREAFEETGFDVALHRKVGVYENIDLATGGVWNHVHLFEGNVVSGTFQPEFPGCEGAWFPVDKLPSSAMPVTKTRIADALEHQDEPFFKQYRPVQTSTFGLQIIDSVEAAAHPVDEDGWDHTQSAMWLLDGATSLEKPYFSLKSDAKWLVDIASQKFKQELTGYSRESRLSMAVRLAAEDIGSAMSAKNDSDYLPPSAAVTLVEICGDVLHYFSLGNITLIHSNSKVSSSAFSRHHVSFVL